MTEHLQAEIARRTLLGSAAALALVASAGPVRAAAGQVYVIAELVAKPGSEKGLRDLLIPFCTGARKEPGCVHYTLMEVAKEPGRFLTYEIWADQAAIDAHMTTPEIKAAGTQLANLLGKPFTQTFLTGLT